MSVRPPWKRGARPPSASGRSLASDLSVSFRKLAGISLALILVALAYFASAEFYFNPEAARYSAGRESLNLANTGMLDQQTAFNTLLASGSAGSGDPSFLEPYARGKREVRDGDAGLSALADREQQRAPAVQAYLAAQRQWTDGWVKQALDPSSPHPELLLPEGDQLFNLYRSAKDQMSRALDQGQAEALSESRTGLAVAAGLEALLAATLVTVWLREQRRLRQRVVAPVRQLLEVIEALGTGDRKAITTVDGPAEISTIAEALSGAGTLLELHERTRELERANRELEQFSHLASHDLQEPLRMVVSHLQLLERQTGGRLNGEARECMDFILREAARMRLLMDALLIYSRAGRWFDLDYNESAGACADAAVRRLTPLITEAGATIRVEDLPRVGVNADQLTQLFENLIDNSLTFRGDASPLVEISASCEEGNCTFSLQDNGIGIPAHQTERVFLVFQQLHARDAYPEHAGIGLAICKRIVEQYGGRIWVEPDVEQGTLVRFTLPLPRPEPDPPVAATMAEHVGGPAPPPAGLKGAIRALSHLRPT